MANNIPAFNSLIIQQLINKEFNINHNIVMFQLIWLQTMNQDNQLLSQLLKNHIEIIVEVKKGKAYLLWQEDEWMND